MPHTPTPAVTPAKALLNLRIIWAAMVTSVIVLAVALVFIPPPANQQPQPGGSSNLQSLFTIIGFALLVAEVPAGLFIRNQIYKKNWQRDVVTPQGYATGNILLFAMLEGIALFSLTVTYVTRGFGLVTIPGLLAWSLLLINFPTGKPMLPPANPYQTPLTR